MKAFLNAGTPVEMDWRFLGFFGLYIGVFIALVNIPTSLTEDASSLTASSVALFWQLFRIPVSSLGTQVTFYDFPMEIILECSGVHYAGIFAAAVLAFPGRPVSHKAVGLVAGIGAIFLLNVVRLGMLGLIGHFFADLFSFIHLYLWHALFTFIVLVLWVLWVNGRFLFSWRQVLVLLGTASLAFWVLLSTLEYYYAFLAFLADGIFPLLGVVLNMPTGVISNGEYIGYQVGELVIYSTTGLYTLNNAVFIALVAVAAFRTADRWLIVKRVLAGAGFMVLFHLGMLYLDWLLEALNGELLASLLHWGIVLLSMIAPLIAWLGATLLVTSRSSGSQV